MHLLHTDTTNLPHSTKAKQKHKMLSLRCFLFCFLLVAVTSAAWTSLLHGFSLHARPTDSEAGLAHTTARLAVPPVRGGGFLWWKSTDEKAEAAKDHAKKSWFWGKEYAKDKADQSKEAAAAKAEAAKRKAAQAKEQSKADMAKVKRNLSTKYEYVKEHAKHVVGATKDSIKDSASATKGAVKDSVDVTKGAVATGKHKVEAVGNTVEILDDVKRGYDKYQTGKAKATQAVHGVEETVGEGVKKTKNVFRRMFEFFWWPAARPRATTTVYRSTVKEEPFVLEEDNVVTAPRCVDEALEEFEACKVTEMVGAWDWLGIFIHSCFPPIPSRRPNA